MLDTPVIWMTTHGRRIRQDTVTAVLINDRVGSTVYRTVYEILEVPIGSPRVDIIIALYRGLVLPDAYSIIVILDHHMSYSGRLLEVKSGSSFGGDTVIRIAVLRTVARGLPRVSQQGK